MFSVLTMTGCSAYQARTVLEPLGTNGWVSSDHVAKYSCNSFVMVAHPSPVAYGRVFYGPLGLTVIPNNVGGGKERLQDYNLPETLNFPDNLHVIIEVIDSKNWDFSSPPKTQITYNGAKYSPLQQINIDYRAQYIYAFDLLPENINEFNLSFTKPFEGCDINDIVFKKNTVHNYQFNALKP